MTRLASACRRLRRDRRVVSGVVVAATLVVCVLGWLAAGPLLQNWAVGLGMDDERGALIAALLVAAGGAATTALASGRSDAPRAGAVLGFVAVEVAPFLVRGTRVTTTPGLSAHLTLSGWFAQPVGMVLLAAITVSLGAAGGVLARRDVVRLVRLLRRRNAARAILPLIALLAWVGIGAAQVALQDGPVSALYGYSWPGQVQPQSAAPVTPVPPPPADQPEPTATPGGSTRTAGAHPPGVRLVSRGPVRTPAPAPPHRPGFSYIDFLWIGGHSVDVYVPAAYDLAAQRRFPAIYFLHGYPGNDAQWLGSGAQLPGVLDQMIATGQMPPVIAVMPDGNGQVLSDAEWGDDADGDHVERWLTTQVVPAIDGRYRTLGATYRGIAGVSAGGFGAVNIAIHHPDLFRWAGSYSGYFTARPEVFGSGSLAQANSPDLTAPKVSTGQRMPLYVGVGDTDTEFLSANHDFVAELAQMGWTPVQSEVVTGGHGWEAWRAEMVDSLRSLRTLWGVAPGVPVATPSPGPSASPSPSPSPSASASPSPSPTP